MEKTKDCVICSPVKKEREESKIERKQRLRQLQNLVVALTTADNMIHHVWDFSSNQSAMIEDCLQSEVAIKINHAGKEKKLHVPFGIIREVWMTHEDCVGLILDAAIVLPMGDLELWLDYHGINH
jgi:hypothetical protein